MKIKIHWEVGDYEDSVIIEGDTDSDIKEKIDAVLKQRGLDPDKNNCWSEDL